MRWLADYAYEVASGRVRGWDGGRYGWTLRLLFDYVERVHGYGPLPAEPGRGCPVCGAEVALRGLPRHLAARGCGRALRDALRDAVTALREARALIRRAGTTYRCTACGARFPTKKQAIHHALHHHIIPHHTNNNNT